MVPRRRTPGNTRRIAVACDLLYRPARGPEGASMTIEVKICGINSPDAALAAAAAGADMIGLVFYRRSPRFVTPDEAAGIARALPPNIKKVGLFVDASDDEIAAAPPGGNALAFDWELLRGFSSPRPWMLSGGLTPENVREALGISGARAVDVSSGVEGRAGPPGL